MTSPTPVDTSKAGDAGQASTDRPRYRPGQVVSFHVTDPTSGDRVSGHGLVLRVQGETADLAVLGAAHVAAHLDNIAAAKVDEVHNPLPAPAPAAEAPAGS